MTPRDPSAYCARPTPADPSATPAGPGALSERLADEMVRRWRQGERPMAEEFLDRHPELWDDAEAAADLIYEEVCLRQERGEAGAAADVLRRFPHWREPLEVLLRFHQLLAAEPTPTLPAAGEVLGDFTLVRELGRGACGRVFLARQTSLAGRPVVLKVTPRDGNEHLSLARLQHTNIVPLHGTFDEPGRGLRVLVMPYFGGVTLAGLLAACAARPAVERSGRLLLELLDASVAEPAPLPARGAFRHFLGRASYVDAVCALGAHLADALHYAHEHGLVHLDVKPSNVLIAADGQPMLLDFHLAREPLQPFGAVPEGVGGTLEYMAPEQRAALDATRSGEATPVAVDGRADVYALGLVLYQALGGPVPPPATPPRLERVSPGVSIGLADIIHRCLAAAPAGRYAADQLAADLRRHLADLPLRGVPNRSLAERWRKWCRRRPHGLRIAGLLFAVALLAAAIMVIAGHAIASRQAEVRALVDRGVQERQSGAFAQAVATLEQARHHAHGLPWSDWWPDELARQADEELARTRADGAEALRRRAADHRQHGEYAAARQALRQGLALVHERPEHAKVAEALAHEQQQVDRLVTAQELHGFVDRLRFRAGVGVLPAEMLADCRRWWDRRHDLAASADDLLDLALLWTDMTPRGAGHAEAALAVLREAEEEFGPSGALARQRRRHATALGKADPVTADAPPRTAWECCALGRALLRDGDLEQAAAALRRAVEQQPDTLWPNFYEGVCAFRRNRYDDAVAAFTACVALAPASADCRYNRGLAFEQLGRLDQALADLDRALALDPGHAAAALSRGAVHLRRQELDQAAADLQRALAAGADPATVHFNFALLYQARGDHDSARRSVDAVLQHAPGHAGAISLRRRLRP